MSKLTVSREEILEVFTDSGVDLCALNDFNVVGGRTLCISQMYEHLSMNVKTMIALSEYFGTQDWDTDLTSSPGCETCDYGSSYDHDITFKDYDEIEVVE